MPLNEAEIEAAARRLLAHRESGIALPPPGDGPSDVAEGYAIQHALDRILREERGWRHVGWKIGATSPAARSALGIAEPFFGRLYDRLIAPSPATLPASATWRAHEPEIALLLGRGLDPAAAPFDAAAIAAATAAVLPAIEVVGSVFAPLMEAGGAALTADNAALGFWVAGAAVQDWSDLDLLEAPVTLLVDGAAVAVGRGSVIAGGAFASAAWLANALAAQGLALRAGDTVTTGTVTAPVAAAPGQRVRAVFDGLGEVALDIAAA